MLHKILILLIVATIPGVVFLTVRQVYTYEKIDGEVNSLLMEQRELFEQNKRMVTNISILSSPERIDELAETTLGLTKGSGDRIIIKIDSGAGDE